MMPELMKSAGVTEALKASDPLKWAGLMNSCKARRGRDHSERAGVQLSYNDIKAAHPDEIVLFQVGDFFEIYGEDAKQAAELLDLNLTREIPGAGRVEMCGVPSHNLRCM